MQYFVSSDVAGQFKLLVLGRNDEVVEYLFELDAKKRVHVDGLGNKSKRFRSLEKALKYFAKPNVFPRPPAPLFTLVPLVALNENGDGDEDEDEGEGEGEDEGEGEGEGVT